jgi:bifunctional non-homologous end joining protein LigD
LSVKIGRHDVAITHPNKLLFPDDGVTKQDLVDYYRRASRWIVPHLRARPVAMERYPDGIDKPGFFQKTVPTYYPDWITTVAVKKKTGGTTRHVLCDNAATLVYLVNQACVTPHVWLSQIDELECPDQMVFDLDPSSHEFELVKSTAQSLKLLLDALGLPAYVKTSGSRGLHVVVPLRRVEPFDCVRRFARELARIVVDEAPRQRTLEQRTDRRRGRVFVDTNRNAYAQHVAPAYAVRARRRAPVSTPIDWHELGRSDLRPDGTTIRNVFDRLAKTADPWREFWRRRVSLTRARMTVEGLYGARRVPQEEDLY